MGSLGKKSEDRKLCGPVVGAFVSVGDGEEVGFFPRLADELGADREATLRETTRDADRGEAGEVYANRINIAEVKCERVGFLTDLKRGHRRGGRQERIDVAECVKEILPDERTHFLRMEIVESRMPNRPCFTPYLWS